MLRRTGLVLFALFAMLNQIHASHEIKLASYPRVSPNGETLIFEWHGDIYTVPITGGDAKPLVTHEAYDTNASFSPDGKEIVFASGRDETWQLYRMPVEGGQAVKFTNHSHGYTPLEWYPDGKSMLVTAGRDYMGLEWRRIFRVPLDPSKSEELLFDGYGNSATLSPDATKMLFTREGVDLYYRQYKGSKASQIWLYDLKEDTFKQICGDDRGSRSPMWKPDGSGFYYISERDGCYNIYDHDFASGKEKQLTFFKNASIIMPTISRDGSTIVFRQLFDFYRLNPTNGQPPQKITITTKKDSFYKETDNRKYTTCWNMNQWGGMDYTNDGLEIAFNTGGDTWVMDTVYRRPIAVTSDAGIQDLEVVFDKKGETLYLLRDDGLGINLWKAERKNPDKYWWQNRNFVLTKITDDRENRYALSVSPDGKQVLFTQGRGRLSIMNIDGSGYKLLRKGPYVSFSEWSPDGKWVLGNVQDSYHNSDIWLIPVDNPEKAFNLSRNYNWDGHAAWSPDGRKIAFLSRTFSDKLVLKYVYLRKEDDEESQRERDYQSAVETLDKARKNGKNGKNGKKADAKKGEKKSIEVKIDFDGLFDRIRTVQKPVVNSPSGLFWSYDSKALAFRDTINGRRGTYKLVFPAANHAEFMTSKNGFYAKWLKNGSKIMWMVDGVPHSFNSKYSFQLYQTLDTKSYYRLGFRQIWKALRDNFYDEKMNNLDWEQIRLKYEGMILAQPTRSTLSKIAAMINGELSASHLGFSMKGGKRYSSGDNWRISTAHLGVRFDQYFKGPGLRVSMVIAGGPADLDKSRLKIGEIITHIDGNEVNQGDNLNNILNGRLPRLFDLTVKGLDGQVRNVTLDAIDYDKAWKLVKEQEIVWRKDKVDELSDGKLGYVLIRKMNHESLLEFKRKLFENAWDKEGLVVDVRNNPGGFTADRILDILCPQRHAKTFPRDGEESYPKGYWDNIVWQKPLVVLCNQNSCSNAEIFSNSIKSLKRGKVIGVPTQGCVISAPNTDILDFGNLRIPDRGWYNLEDGHDLDYIGVQPDIIIWPKPGELAKGIDRQLEKAVEVVLKEVEEHNFNDAKPVKASKQRIEDKYFQQ